MLWNASEIQSARDVISFAVRCQPELDLPLRLLCAFAPLREESSYKAHLTTLSESLESTMLKAGVAQW
jgi:hypothetical protein